MALAYFCQKLFLSKKGGEHMNDLGKTIKKDAEKVKKEVGYAGMKVRDEANRLRGRMEQAADDAKRHHGK